MNEHLCFQKLFAQKEARLPKLYLMLLLLNLGVAVPFPDCF